MLRGSRNPETWTRDQRPPQKDNGPYDPRTGTAIRVPRVASGADRPWRGLVIVVLCGLAVRMAALPFDGYASDMAEFTRWAMLASHAGLQGLYTVSDPVTHHVVNYPPLYALILAATARLYQTLHVADPDHRILAMLLKVPATLADLAICVVTFLFVNRWFSQRRALVAGMIAALSPTTWLISSYWGQVDSLAAVFVALALYAMVRKQYVVGWIVLALGVLIKPQPIVIAPLLLLWQGREEGFSPRLALGPAAAIVMTYLVSIPFVPSLQPLAVFAWVANLLHVGVDLFPDTSVGAFNLYTIKGWFYQSDTVAVLGVPLRTWGEAAFGALVALVAFALAARLARERDRSIRERVLVTACFIVLAGMFVLLTRMHERYLLFAVALVPTLWYVGRWERAVGATMMVTFTLNCAWVLFDAAHAAAPVAHAAGNATNHLHRLAVLVGHGLSLINVVALGAIVYHFGGDALSRYSLPDWGRAPSITRPSTSLRTNVLWLAACAALLGIAFLKATPFPTSDSAYFEFVGRQMAHGAHLYRDVWDNKLPSIYLTNALWQTIMGEQYRLHIAAEIAIQALSAILFAVLLRSMNVRPWAAATFAFAVIVIVLPSEYNSTERYALPLSLLAMLWLQKEKPILCGIALVAATSYWMPAGLLVLPVLAQWRANLGQFTRFLSAAFAAVVLEISAAVAFIGVDALRTLAQSWVLYVTEPGQTAGASVSRSLRLGLYTSGAGVLLPLFAARVQRPQTPAQRLTLWWSIGTLIGAMTSARFYGHYFLLAIPALIAAIAVFPPRPVRWLNGSAVVLSAYFAVRSAQYMTIVQRSNTALDQHIAHTARTIELGIGPGAVIQGDAEPGVLLAAHSRTRTPYELASSTNRRFVARVTSGRSYPNADAWLLTSGDQPVPSEAASVCPGEIEGWRLFVRRDLAPRFTPRTCLAAADH
ncbi:MAG: putative rane protein [Candidatus Eremiobacteraeota bacterium]|nr:putative rane protein [Candidatus Eremiobacteraeota bacterium]